jgi:hypothetical protein
MSNKQTIGWALSHGSLCVSDGSPCSIRTLSDGLRKGTLSEPTKSLEWSLVRELLVTDEGGPRVVPLSP